MVKRPGFLEAIGNSGAAIQIWFWDFVGRIMSDVGNLSLSIWRHRFGQWFLLAGLLVGYLVFGGQMDVWSWVDSPEKARDTATILAAPAAVLTIYLLARRTKAIEEQALVSASALKLDRYVRTLEMLSSSELSTRLGAVQGLREIGLGDEQGLEALRALLSSFIVDRGLLRKEHLKDKHSIESFSNVTDQMGIYSQDIVSALDVALDFSFIIEGRNKLDIEHAKLPIVDLEERVFEGSHLRYVEFAGSILWDCKFIHCFLFGADFSHCQGSRADFRRSNVSYAKFDGAILDGADFRNAWLKNTTFEGADLTDTDFRGAMDFLSDSIVSASWEPDRPPKLPTGMSLPPRDEAET